MTALSALYSNTILYSLGSGNNLGKAKNVSETIRKFADRFREPHVTPETYREYKAMGDTRQQTLKGIAGWMMRGSIKKGENRNRNSIQPSKLMTLDIDYATPEFVELLKAGKILPGVALIAHSTRSHTPENPRLRIIIFLEEAVSRDRYQAACRITAKAADPEMQWVDKVSFRPAQMMFMPTVSKDMKKHYVFYEQGGDLWDHEEAISQWELINGSADDIGNLPRTPGEDELREAAEFAEDPLDKKGPVGDFCRAYSITELVEGKDGEKGILSHVYAPSEWHQGAITRMTWLGGHSHNGAVVYDDKFVYSHHGTDPTADHLVNAYDLVRLHLFGDHDDKVDSDTPMKDLPSTKKMTEMLRGDQHYRIAQAESRYDIEEMLQDDDVEYETDDRPGASELLDGIDDEEQVEIDDLLGEPVDTPWSKRKDRQRTRKTWAKAPPKRWIATKLELTDDGIIKTTMPNIAYIVLYDPRFFRKVAFNLFSKSIVFVGDFKSKMELIPSFKCEDKQNGDDWQEINDLIVRTIIELPAGNGGSGYGIKVGKEMVHDAVRVAGNRNTFHPILEYLDDLRDQEPLGPPDLIERLFIDYYGCPDTRYYRDLSRLILIASVARVEEPGCKFDYAVVVEGEQGTRKSSSIMALYSQQYFGEIDGDLGNLQKTAEQIAGKWALELPELSAMHKSEANDTKAFMSRQQDDVRMVYDRNKSKFPRQCVIWGTTNDQQYLRDTTGGRRYLIVELLANMIDTDGILRDRGAIWQAAARGYDEMREEQPYGTLPLFLQGESADEAKRLQERARKTEVWEHWLEAVTDWMDEELTLTELLAENDLLADGPMHLGYSTDSIVVRVALTRDDVMRVVLGAHGNVPTNAQMNTAWQSMVDAMKKMGWGHERVRVAGKQLRYLTIPTMT